MKRILRAAPAPAGRAKRAGQRRIRPQPGRTSVDPPSRPRRRVLPWLTLALVLPLVALAIDAARLARGVAHPARAATVTLLDRHGIPLTTSGDGWARPLALEDVSPRMVQAILAIEDRRFFQHAGIDPAGIGRALLRNLSSGRVAEGGSTITQQLAKLAFLSPDRSFLRKAREAALALWLEAGLSKQEILAAYLDRIYLGGGVTGIRAAARRHFGVEARDLDLAQAALLAGLVRAPSRLDPGRDLDAARRRAAVVLQAMVAVGSIDQATADRVRTRPAKVLAAPFPDPILRTLAQRARQSWPGSALIVRTTLDRPLAERASAILSGELARLPARAGAAALLAIGPGGEVLAAASLPGGSGGVDRVTGVRRQPGSAFKPILFAAAVEAGHRPTETISTSTPDIDGWRPRNITPAPAPHVTLQQAMSLSINTSAVRLATKLGLGRLAATARRLGIASDLPPVPSLALGSAEVGMVELAGAYAALAGDGMVRAPIWWTSVADESGEMRNTERPAAVRALSTSTAVTMRAMLADAMRNGTGKAAAIAGGFGKTGTSSGFRDAWFVGGDAKGMIVAVWVGNDDHAPMAGETGGGLPARIFRGFMTGGP
jgi:penicillin-binding protein 1A